MQSSNPTTSGDNATTTLIEGKTEHNSTTTYVDDGLVAVSAMKNYTPVNTSLYQSSSDHVDQDIKSFLSKPVIVKQGTLSTGDLVSTFSDLKCPEDIFSANLLYTRKTDGNVGFRGDMVFKMVVNGNRFSMGRYILSFIYTGGGPDNTKSGYHVQYHKNSLTARTQLYHVEIDLSCDTSCELRVPFLSALNYFPLTNAGAVGNIGYLSLSPYIDYKFAAGSTGVNFNIYAHFENVELIGATNPQSLSNIEGDKPMVSSILLAGSNFLNEVGKIPAISNIARPAAWVADYLGNSAKALGFSKPVSEKETTRVVRDCLPGLCNADVIDTSKKQSTFQSNEISHLKGIMGTDMDELSLLSIASRYAWINTSTMSTSDPTGTLIASFSVHPYANIQSRTTNAWVVADYTPLQFTASYFNYWRGTLKFRLKFVRTEFHSGRIAVCFFPNETFGDVSTTFSYAASDYVHKHIIDIREHNEIELEIPFISSTPYKRVVSGHAVAATGTLAFYVVDQLNAPATVPSTIYILTEHAGGDDIEFAVPANTVNQPIYGITPQAECNFGKFVLGSAKLSSDTIVNASTCIGERVSSFRSLVKAYQLLTYQASANPFTAAKPNLNIIPYANPVAFTILGSTAMPQTNCDLISALCSIFLFSRGSLRLKMIPRSSNSGIPCYSFNYYPDESTADASDYYELSDFDAGGVAFVSNRIMAATTAHNTAINQAAEIELPQYLPYPVRVNYEHMMHSSMKYSFGTSSMATRLKVTFNSATSVNISTSFDLYRAGADDFEIGQFISIGPMKVGVYNQH